MTLIDKLAAKAVDSPVHQLRDQCSSPLNHHWEETEADRNPIHGGWYLSFRCVKCGSIARQIVYNNGAITPRRYKYPKEWHKSNWKRSDWRANYIAKLNGRH